MLVFKCIYAKAALIVENKLYYILRLQMRFEGSRLSAKTSYVHFKASFNFYFLEMEKERFIQL